MGRVILLTSLLLASFAGPSRAGDKPSTFPYVVYTGRGFDLWRIDKAGHAKSSQKLPWGLREGNMEGSTEPTLSPDGKKLAYLKANNLWVKDLSSGKPLQLTTVGFEKDPKYLPVHPLISGWSQDGSKLLYYLQHMEAGEEAEGDGPDEGFAREVKQLDYGYYFYDQASGKTTPLGLEDAPFVGWDHDGEMVFQPTGTNTTTLLFLDPDLAQREFVVNSPRITDAGQFFMSTSKNEAVGLVGDFAKWNKVVRVDLRDASTEDLTPQKGWGEVNWPSLSPSGKHLAWVRSGGYLVVDGKELPGLKDLSLYRWVDEEKLVAITIPAPGKQELLVIQALDGKVLDRHPL